MHQLLEPLFLSLHLDEALELRVGSPQPAAGRRLHAAAATTFTCRAALRPRMRTPAPLLPPALPLLPPALRMLSVGRPGAVRGGLLRGSVGLLSPRCAHSGCPGAVPFPRPVSSSHRHREGRAAGDGHGSSSVMSTMLPSSAVKVGRSSAFCGARGRAVGARTAPCPLPDPQRARTSCQQLYMMA